MRAMDTALADRFARAHLAVLERGWLSSNSVLFTPPDGETVLVDTGYGAHAAQTVALVRHALGSRTLARIVNTHLHSDHCGGNAALQSAHGCAIDVPAGDADAVDRWDEDALSYRSTGQQCARFKRTGTVSAGDLLRLGGYDWQVIASPGHDPHSVVLHQPDLGVLISADALWEHGFGVVFPELDDVARSEGFDALRATLARLRALRARVVIPGHGAPFDDVEPALDRAERLLDTLAADPARHARHAAKVLIKFHLMEVRAEPLGRLRQWARQTPVFAAIRHRDAPSPGFDDWLLARLDELRRGGALRVEGGHAIDA
jgi:glyoxylase-like metal-dependent hydrolase (beta-lactamase superfamily II)